MWRNPDRTFLLHHTREGRPGVCASDDDNPPPEEAVIARLTHEQVIGLGDDIEEVLQWCFDRDGRHWPEDD